MIAPGLIVALALGYLGALFALAAWADRRADAGRSMIARPTVYALSLAVYCTAWTFFGSVGRAAEGGLAFLPIYLGPTLAALLWGVVVRKMVRVSRYHRLTSLADLVASRYGKSGLLGGVVAIVAVVGVVPYVALQLKAVSTAFRVLTGTGTGGAPPIVADTALYVAVLLALFAILFGARHLDATERHEGLVAAVAADAVVKLVAFLAVGAFVVWGLFAG
ncbi:MAG: histidine kinase, partial [Bacteroidota bacterium]